MNSYFFSWESDMLAFNEDGEVIEFEVKLSASDFRADKNKQKHLFMNCRDMAQRRIPSKFYYACPAGVIYPKSLPDHAGLIWMDTAKKSRFSKCGARIIKPAPVLTGERMGEHEWLSIIEKSNEKMIKLWQKVHGEQ